MFSDLLDKLVHSLAPYNTSHIPCLCSANVMEAYHGVVFLLNAIDLAVVAVVVTDLAFIDLVVVGGLAALDLAVVEAPVGTLPDLLVLLLGVDLVDPVEVGTFWAQDLDKALQIAEHVDALDNQHIDASGCVSGDLWQLPA